MSRRRMRSRATAALGAAVAAVVVLLGVWGTDGRSVGHGSVVAAPEAPKPPPPPGTDSGTDPLVSAGRLALPTLAVRDADSPEGYSRALFGQAWSDDVSVEGGHDGCDTRNDVLRRDLRGVALKPGTRDCVVLSGELLDPYTGATIAFVRGSSSSTVQVDHVVALAAAWRTGARELDPDRRRDLANDPLGLLAVSAATNSAKSDSDASGWLPPAEGARCGYVARQVLVKQRYGLWVTPAERSALDRQFALCP